MYAVGLMSGTSLDGIDAVLCELSGHDTETRIKTIAFLTYPIPEQMKAKIRRCCANEAHVDEVCSLNFELGELFAQSALQVCRNAGIPSTSLGFIASHGQTIYHQPTKDAQHVASTLQIGEPAIIAQRCGCLTIANFRTKDMAVGGEGAPLVPFSEYVLYQHPTRTIALQNIGGIANVTILPAGGNLQDLYAFDTGPGNMIIDEALHLLYQKPYDEQGNIAATGKRIPALCDEFLKDPYLTLPPPKSTGRERYGEAFTKDIVTRYAHESPADIITTCTWFTAMTIARSYQLFVLPNHPLSTIVLGGGGAHNLTLRTMLAEALPGIEITTQDALGYSSDAKEAIAFVILGNETLHQHTSNVMRATGARQSVILGNLTYPD